jgi:ubiquinone/menaquinone biosynthesis C-methylase UbiE
LEHKYVLDAGGGTGYSLAIVDRAARYVAIDIDGKKLARLRTKRVDAAAVGADISSLPIASGGVDIGLLVFVCHHLDDETLSAALRELARVCADYVLIMDPVWMPRRWRAVCCGDMTRASFRAAATTFVSRSIETSLSTTRSNSPCTTPTTFGGADRDGRGSSDSIV